MTSSTATLRLFALGLALALGWPAAGGSTGEFVSPATPAPAGTLSVSSDPQTAAVFVDGLFIGQTPVDVPGLPAGDHRVRLVKDGFLENSRVVSIGGARTKTLAVHLTARAQSPAAQPTGLHIVVIAGEGAVNILMRNTAVAPIVEVRDRNNLPVAGATVVFTIGGGNAASFAGGSQTLSVTTSAAGRAATTALRPTMPGPFQIQVQTTVNGQAASATISQVNVATAAAAAAAGGAVAGAAAGGAAGAGATAAGGLSGAAIAGIVGAAGGGALVAVKAASGGGSSSSGSSSSGGNGSPSPTTPGGSPATTTFSGPFSGQMVMTTTTTSSFTTSCDSTRSITGTLTLALQQQSDGTVTGTGSTNGTETETAVTASPFCSSSFGSAPFTVSGAVTGTPANLGFSFQSSSTSTTIATVTVTNTTIFTGSLVGGVIAGTITHSEVSTGQQNPPNNGVIAGSGTTNLPVTLR